MFKVCRDDMPCEVKKEPLRVVLLGLKMEKLKINLKNSEKCSKKNVSFEFEDYHHIWWKAGFNK